MDSRRVSTSFSINKIHPIQEQSMDFLSTIVDPSTLQRIPGIQGMVNTQSKICDALRDLVPFVLFKKREKHP